MLRRQQIADPTGFVFSKNFLYSFSTPVKISKEIVKGGGRMYFDSNWAGRMNCFASFVSAAEKYAEFGRLRSRPDRRNPSRLLRSNRHKVPKFGRGCLNSAWLFCASSLSGLLLLGVVQAEAQLPPAAQAQPGISPDRVPPLATPLAEPDVIAPTPVEPDLPAGADEARFFLADIVIDGVTVYDSADLTPIYGEFLQTEVSLATLYGIASAIETRYREDGYILSRAIVPAQSVSDGVYRIQVIEGYVTNVVIEGEIGNSRVLIPECKRHQKQQETVEKPNSCGRKAG